MPLGKLGTMGACAFVDPWMHYGINIRSLRRRAKRGVQPLTRPELCKYRKTLRQVVGIYRIAKNQHPTATKRKDILSKIKKRAQKFIESRKILWLDKLLDCFVINQSIDSDTLALVLRQLPNGIKSLHEIRKGRNALYSTFERQDAHLQAFLQKHVTILCVLAEIDIASLVPGSGKWSDPALANLVLVLEPIWCRVAGRTAELISSDATCDKKHSPFADWLEDIFQKMGLPSPPVGSVVDIVRDKNKKIRHPSRID